MDLSIRWSTTSCLPTTDFVTHMLELGLVFIGTLHIGLIKFFQNNIRISKLLFYDGRLFFGITTSHNVLYEFPVATFLNIPASQSLTDIGMMSSLIISVIQK